MPRPEAETTVLGGLEKRFKARLSLAMDLARAYRFIVELEPPPGDSKDPFEALAPEFRVWRQALRNEDSEAGLDALERAWTRIEACQRRVGECDAGIQAYRLRWACENAPLGQRTVESLGRFYRLLPISTPSQSKYEYVLTRLLAGPMGPERRLSPTDELIETVRSLEASWRASAVQVDDDEVATIALALKSFAHEATRQADVATFTTSALMRRFGAFKASIGEMLFDPRLGVAVVETNVAVLNVLNQLLAEVGGQPFRWTTAIKRSVTRRRTRAGAPRKKTAEIERPGEPFASDKPLVDGTDPRAGGRPLADAGGPIEAAEAPKDPEADAPPARLEEEPEAPAARPESDSRQIDLSGIAFLRGRGRPAPPTEPVPEPFIAVEGAEAAMADVPPSPPLPTELQAEAGIPEGPAQEEPPTERPSRPDLRTGEVDISGLEIVGRVRRPPVDLPPGLEPTETDSADEGEYEDQEEEESRQDDPEVAAGAALDNGAAEDAGQQPSLRALDLAKLEENAAIIERYLSWPRSPEVWQLDLDAFLGPVVGEVLGSEVHKTERRRAFELILAADDLICERETQEGAATAEHKGKVKSVSNAMLLLRTSLHRGADLARADPKELEILLYVSDHLLWERLRLDSSLKRNPRRAARRKAKVGQVGPRDSRRSRFNRYGRLLIGTAVVATILALIAGLTVTVAPPTPPDQDVAMVPLDALPGVQVFDEGRSFRTTLFITASPTWVLLGKEERRSLVRSLGAFAIERGFTTVSVLGPKGEPLASFSDDEVTLDSDLTEVDPTNR